MRANKSKRIGFVGVGRMGANMARRLHDCGYRVTVVHDLDREAAGALAGEIGAVAVSRLPEVPPRADIVFTVVSDDAAMRRIFGKGPNSLLALPTKARTFINCATVSPEIHRKVETWVNERGGSVLEACMASSIPQARDGKLYLMVGGQEKVFRRLEPILKDLAENLRYLGPAGRAAEVKALVNMVMNINTAALAEGLGLGHALGIDLTLLREVFAQTGAASRVLQTDGEDMQFRQHECFFSAAHAAKDSAIAASLGRRARRHLPLNDATLQQFQRLVALGLGGLDKSGVAELTFGGRSGG